jgi:hypothetical protein
MTNQAALARGFAVLRGLMLMVFMVFWLWAPDKALHGSSTEPARSLALMFVSRTMLLGAALVALAIKGKRQGLGWLLLADAALQIFDVGMAVAAHKGVVVLAPAALGALDLWAGLVLLRTTARP